MPAEISMVDVLAVVYAYLLAFIVLGLIVAALTLVYRLTSRQPSVAPAGVTPKPATQEVPPQPSPQPQAPPPQVQQLPKPPAEGLVEKIAAAVAAVATHLSVLTGAPIATATQVPQVAVGGWVARWRSQVATSPNEVSYLLRTRRWS